MGRRRTWGEELGGFDAAVAEPVEAAFIGDWRDDAEGAEIAGGALGAGGGGPWVSGIGAGFERGIEEPEAPCEDETGLGAADAEGGGIAEEGFDPCGAVDEGIAVALALLDAVVATDFVRADGVGEVPDEKRGETPAVGLTGAGEGHVIGELEICFVGGFAVVAEVHVEERAGDVAFDFGRGFP